MTCWMNQLFLAAASGELVAAKVVEPDTDGRTHVTELLQTTNA